MISAHIKNVCKLGEGAACCRYISLGPRGWSCEKLGELRHLIDRRVEHHEMHAEGDNCDGERNLNDLP